MKFDRAVGTHFRYRSKASLRGWYVPTGVVHAGHGTHSFYLRNIEYEA